MPKQRINLRVDEGLHAWAVEYASKRSSTTTAVYELALAELRAVAEAGVPDLPGPAAKVARHSAVPSGRRAAVRPPVPAEVPVVPASQIDRAAVFRQATQRKS